MRFPLASYRTRRLVGGAVVAATLLLLSASPALAQTCLGRLSFADQPVQAQFGGVFGSGTQQFAPGVAVGGTSWFGGVAAPIVNRDDVPFDIDVLSFDTAIGVQGFGGAEFHLGRVAVYPIGGVGYVFGPRTTTTGRSLVGGLSGGGSDERSVVAEAGGAVGVLAVDNDTVQVIPMLRMSFQYQRRKLALFDNRTLTGSETYGALHVGAGLVFWRKISVTPVAIVPTSDDYDPEFAISTSIGF